jgi:hypothetical protein
MKRYIATLLIVFAATAFTFAQITMQKSDEGILILDEGEKVLFYQSEPLNIEGKYERRHYIHPLWSPGGTVLTEDFPSDHLHHRGVFWAWHQVWIGDQKIGDPWELVDFDQKIAEIEFRSRQDGTGILNTKVNWLSDKWKKMGKKVPYMEEVTTIVVHHKEKNFRRIDFEISLLALEPNLSIGGSDDEKGYSGFSVRMVLPPDVKFTGPNGAVSPEVTAVESPGYINISGSMAKKGKNGGIVIIDNASNPGYPQPWILRAKNSMQNAAFPGQGTIPVSTTSPLVLKYTLLVYTGKMNDKQIKRVVDDLQ